MLDDDRHVGFDDARKIGARGIGRGFCRSLNRTCLVRRAGTVISYGPTASSSAEEQRDPDVGILIASVEDAGGLVALQFRFGAVTPSGNITFGDGPPPFSDRFHILLLRNL